MVSKKPFVGRCIFLLLLATIQDVTAVKVIPHVKPLNGYKNSSPHAPHFTEDVHNATVVVGRSAKLKCSVKNLGKYKIAWIKSDTQTLLSIENTMITRNYRLRASHSDDTTWFLHIKEASMSDRGFYMCQINTVPPLVKQGFLKVVVPPNIIDDKLSADVEVGEGSPAQLKCMATGYPAPQIKFQKQQSKHIKLTKLNGQVTSKTISDPQKIRVALKSNMESPIQENEFSEFLKDTLLTIGYLTIDSVSRADMGHYLCIATNSVPPSVSKRVVLNVRYREPEVVIDQQMLGVYRGDDVAINCTVTAYPRPVVFWQDGSRRMIISGGRYQVVDRQLEESPPVLLTTLFIQNIQPQDITSYTCNASIDNDETRSTSLTVLLNEMARRPTTELAKMDILYPVPAKGKNLKKTRQPITTVNDISERFEKLPSYKPETFIPPGISQESFEAPTVISGTCSYNFHIYLEMLCLYVIASLL